MAKSIIQYDLLISCPGDIVGEIDIIKKNVEEFNERYSDALGISIRARHWSKSAYAQSGGQPQALLNEQFVNECDAAVALLWTRFGTPTDKYGSGTEEEIEIMLDSEKQVFMYFSDKSISPAQINSKEYEKVQAFREKYKNRGIYFTYSSEEEFSRMFFAHLSKYFLTLKSVSEEQDKRMPILHLCGIDNCGTVSEKASFQDFELQAEYNIIQYLEEIKKMYYDIADIEVGKREKLRNSIEYPGCSEVKFLDKEIDCISAFAKRLELVLPEEFFSVGNLLKKPSFGFAFNRESEYVGMEKEKEKFNLINELYEKICDFLKFEPVALGFLNMKCIKLLLENIGTDVDEDIEITLLIDKDAYIMPMDLPNFDNDTMGYLLEECNLEDLLGIWPTAEYNAYKSSLKGRKWASYALPENPLPGFITYYKEYYDNALLKIFCYEVYLKEEYYVLKLKVDYLKHHTSVAFPTPIFLRKKINTIEYSITSKKSPEVISGKLEVSD